MASVTSEDKENNKMINGNIVGKEATVATALGQDSNCCSSIKTPRKNLDFNDDEKGISSPLGEAKEEAQAKEA